MRHWVRVVGKASHVGVWGRRLAVPVALLVLVITAWAAESPEKMRAKAKAEADARALAAPRINRNLDFDVRHLPIGDGPADRQHDPMVDRSIRGSVFVDNYEASAGLGAMNSASALTPLLIAMSANDFQSNDGNPPQIATLGSGQITHFTWMEWADIPDSIEQTGRLVKYNGYQMGVGFLDGYGGATISGAAGDPLKARAGFSNLVVDHSGKSHVAFHQRNAIEQPFGSLGQYSSYVLNQQTPLLPIFSETELCNSKAGQGKADDRIWPHLSNDPRTSGNDVMHCVAHTYQSNDNIYYWRFDGTAWSCAALLDSSSTLSYYVAADQSTASNKVAFLVRSDYKDAINNPNELGQITYRELTDWGLAWTDGNPNNNGTKVYITNYNSLTGPRAWLDMVGEYDGAGNLHIVWVEQRTNASFQARLKHWDKTSGNIRTTAQAYWDCEGNVSARDINLAYPSIGFGDGSTLCSGSPNTNYLYVTYTQFGGPTTADIYDVSAAGFMNANIYLAESNDGGNLWSPSLCLSPDPVDPSHGTRTPGCESGTLAGDCKSEHWATIARKIDDTVHIQYIEDREAGDAPTAGPWTLNPVYYLRLPPGSMGTNPADKLPVCPRLSPNANADLSDANGAECEYNAKPGSSVNEVLTISNLGNAPMTGSVSRSFISPPVPPTPSWLTFGTAPGPLAFYIAAGLSQPYNVKMNAAGLTEGLYKGQISIIHDDLSKGTIVIPINFFVFASFYCPEYVTLHTKWLWLKVSSIERVAYASTGTTYGLYRDPSSLSPDAGNNSIYDGSLVLAKPPVAGDTTVFRYMGGSGNGQPGFRARGHLTQTTSARQKTASAMQSTVDSLIGIDVKYIFPQNLTDSNEFVLVKYTLYNRTPSTTFTGLIPGFGADLDVVPSTANAKYQSGLENVGGIDAAYNLVYQQGTDIGPPPAPPGNIADRYLGGMTAIQPVASPRAWVAPNDPFLFNAPGGYFSDGYLYREMVLTGFEVFPPGKAPTAESPGEDLHSVLAFEQNVTLAPTGAKHYVLGLVSSVGGPGTTDLMNTVKKAWKFAFGWSDVVTADCVKKSTAKSWPYFVVGSHETGLGGGCSGCVVTKQSGAAEFSVVPDANQCSGKIQFAATGTNGIYTATFRATTIPCAGTLYSEDVVVTVKVQDNCNGPYLGCDCPWQGDINADGIINVLDVVNLVNIVFRGRVALDVKDPFCPVKRGDVNGDGITNVLDVMMLINAAFSAGPKACNPCKEGCPR